MSKLPDNTPRTACPSYFEADLSRRRVVSAGGMGLLGLSMPRLLAAADRNAVNAPKPARPSNPTVADALHAPPPKPRAKQVIFLFQWGGPSHIDMFDMKPDAPDRYRGPYRPVRSKAPGIHISEKLPRTREIMDRACVIRSMTHTMNNHNSAGYYALTGSAPPRDDQRLRDSLSLYPSYGSVVDRFAPSRNGMPTYVSYPHTISDGSKTPGQGASFLGKRHDPLFVPRDPAAPDFALPELSLPEDVSIDRLHHRRGMQQLIDRQSRLMDHAAEARGLDDYYKKALAMLNSDRIRRAFNLADEPKAIRDAYGRTTYGQGCLLSRRLVEAGIKFTTVYFARTIGGRSKSKGGWDTHGFDNTRMFPIIEAYHLPITDHTLPVLINDLDQRGLLDETLVVWMGEFGRTPKINGNKSRDHWPRCYTTLLFGGGVKRGYVYGASDRYGAYPSRDPVRPDDLAATLFYLLGINPETEVNDTEGRALPIAKGKPVLDIIA